MSTLHDRRGLPASRNVRSHHRFISLRARMLLFCLALALSGSVVTLIGTNRALAAASLLRTSWKSLLGTVESSTPAKASAASALRKSQDPVAVPNSPGVATSTTVAFSNTAAIAIPDSGASSPYPSAISVTGMTGAIEKVTVKLTGLTHSYPLDIEALLVGPGGQKFVFMGNAGGTFAVTNRDVTFDDAAGSLLTANGFPSGTYRPTSTFATGGNFPSPAPTAPYKRAGTAGTDTFASVFNGGSPNGTWNLYVWDTVAGSSGNISTGWSLTLTTGLATTTVTNVSTSPNPSVTGQTYTASATLNVPPGSGTPTGTIQFTDQNSELICTATLPATSCNGTTFFAGSKYITASYSGDGSFSPSSSSPAYLHVVNAADTTTSAGPISPPNLTLGDQLVVGWNVSVNPPGTSGDGFAGFVTVTVAGGPETCTAPRSVGSCQLSPFALVGPRLVTVTYEGTPSYNSSSTSFTYTVSKANTVTVITNAPTISTGTFYVGGALSVQVSVNQAIPLPDDFAATSSLRRVSSVPVGPTGTVSVNDGNGGTCTITLPSNSCNITPLSAGPRTITASYNGDFSYEASQTTVSYTVSQAATSLTSLTDSPDPSVVGQTYTAGFTLNVTPPGSATPTAPTGTVTVSDGAGGSCIATLPSTSCPLTSTVAGNKVLTFTYSGDSNFLTSTNTAGHAVNKANTTASITNDIPDPSVIGQNYAVTASVSVNSPGGGTPAGTITVTDGTNNCTITLPATSCNLPSLSVGVKTLTATYDGSADYNASPASAGVPHHVDKADVTVTITSDNPDTSAVGQNVTVAFTVAAAPPGAGTPTGTVTVTISGGSETCTGSLAAGSGSCTLALTAAGSRTLTATYNGDTNFNTGTDTEPHTVVAPPAIAKSFSPSSVPIGGTTQLTLTITNPAVNTVGLTGVGVTDSFPAGLVVATTPGIVTANCGGSTLTDQGGVSINGGDTGIIFGSATVLTSAPCVVKINVTPTVAGPFVNTTTNVTSVNGGTGNTAQATLSTNTPPTISSETKSVKAGSTATSFTIGTAFDPDQAANTLGITINGNPTTATSNGVTVSGVSIAANGAVTASIATTCAATTATFNLVVTDAASATGNGTLTVTVTPNTSPVLTYTNQVVTAGTTPTFFPATGPSDNGNFTIGSVSVTPNNGGLVVLLNQSNGNVTILSALLAGTYTVNVPVTDTCGATTPATLTVTVVCPTLAISPASLPQATVNQAYPQTITATPAGGNYSFSVTSGLLPAGLTLNSNGSFSGAPTQSGTFNFRVSATGFGSCPAFRDYVLVVVCPAMTLSPSSLPNGTVGTGYNQSVTASPAGSYNYAVSSGSLPLGLSLNTATGAITGSPTTAGTYQFTITASMGGCSTSASYTVTIACFALTLSPTSLPNGEAGVAYFQTLSPSPAGSYTFSVIQGSLPPGLTLNPTTGQLSGLVTITGTYSFTVKAQIGTGCFGTQSYTLQIVCPTIQVNPSVALPGGSIGTFYSQTFTATPAGGGYVFSVASGSLPPGLSLNGGTGVMSGTPTTIGTFNFRITATGFGGCSHFRAYTLVIGGATCPTVTLGDIPTTATVGGAYISAITPTPTTSYSYQVTLGSLPPGITLYGSFGLFYGYPTSPGTYNFTVTATDTSGCTGSRQYSIVVTSSFATSQAVGPMVVSAASYRPESATPGGIMAAFGNHLATSLEAASTLPLPTEIAGTQVLVRDSTGVEFASALLFVSETQVNFVIPEEAALGEATLTFISGGEATRTVSTVIERVAPGFFGANGDGSGAAAGYFLRVRSDGTQLEEPAALADRKSGLMIPAEITFGDEGEDLYLVLSGTGMRGRTGLNDVIVMVGGVEGEVTYAGAQGTFAGLDQMNVRIPRALMGRGEVEIEVLIDGKPANILRVQLH